MTVLKNSTRVIGHQNDTLVFFKSIPWNCSIFLLFITKHDSLVHHGLKLPCVVRSHSHLLLMYTFKIHLSTGLIERSRDSKAYISLEFLCKQ